MEFRKNPKKKAPKNKEPKIDEESQKALDFIVTREINAIDAYLKDTLACTDKRDVTTRAGRIFASLSDSAISTKDRAKVSNNKIDATKRAALKSIKRVLSRKFNCDNKQLDDIIANAAKKQAPQSFSDGFEENFRQLTSLKGSTRLEKMVLTNYSEESKLAQRLEEERKQAGMATEEDRQQKMRDESLKKMETITAALAEGKKRQALLRGGYEEVDITVSETMSTKISSTPATRDYSAIVIPKKGDVQKLTSSSYSSGSDSSDDSDSDSDSSSDDDESDGDSDHKHTKKTPQPISGSLSRQQLLENEKQKRHSKLDAPSISSESNHKDSKLKKSRMTDSDDESDDDASSDTTSGTDHSDDDNDHKIDTNASDDDDDDDNSVRVQTVVDQIAQLEHAQSASSQFDAKKTVRSAAYLPPWLQRPIYMDPSLQLPLSIWDKPSALSNHPFTFNSKQYQPWPSHQASQEQYEEAQQTTLPPFSLSPHIIKALHRLGIQSLLPSQATILASLLTPFNPTTSDLCICSPTGTGKTLAYLLPVLNQLIDRTTPSLSCLVIVPTQSLAVQVYNVCMTLMSLINSSIAQTNHHHTPLDCMLVTGGQDIATEASRMVSQSIIEDSRITHPMTAHTESTHHSTNDLPLTLYIDTDIIISTPGKIIEHTVSNPVFQRQLQDLQWIIFDEADKILNSPSNLWLSHLLGYIHAQTHHDRTTDPYIDTSSTDYSTASLTSFTTGGVGGHTTRQVQKLLFSATFTGSPHHLTMLRLNNPVYFTYRTLANVQVYRDSNYADLHSLTASTGSEDAAALAQADASFKQLTLAAPARSNAKYILPPQLEVSHLITSAELKPFMLYLTIQYLQTLHVILQFYLDVIVKSQSTLPHDLPLKTLPKSCGILIFVSSIDSMHRLTRVLELLSLGRLKIAELSSELHITHREKLLSRFKRGEIDILVCTDIASRGIDLPNVFSVINYELPLNTQTMVHRIGRSARGQHYGVGVTLIFPEQKQYLMKMYNSMGISRAKSARGGLQFADIRTVSKANVEQSVFHAITTQVITSLPRTHLLYLINRCSHQSIRDFLDDSHQTGDTSVQASAFLFLKSDGLPTQVVEKLQSPSYCRQSISPFNGQKISSTIPLRKRYALTLRLLEQVLGWETTHHIDTRCELVVLTKSSQLISSMNRAVTTQQSTEIYDDLIDMLKDGFDVDDNSSSGSDNSDMSDSNEGDTTDDDTSHTDLDSDNEHDRKHQTSSMVESIPTHTSKKRDRERSDATAVDQGGTMKKTKH